ncbi:MAG: 50S ribosomal protein L7/L12 [Leptospirales bacterium]
MSVDKLLDEIGNLTLVQAAELVTKMEDKFGISAAAPVAVAAAGADAGPVVEEQSEFTIIFESFSGDKKVDAIKKVREITSLPLMDAKKMVEGSDGTLKENVPKEEANKIKSELEALGAKIALK